MIPIVAILAAVFAGLDPETAGEIGIGAILGAPFMLATLAMFVVRASALYYRNRRVSGAEIRCEGVAADDFPWCKAPGKSVNIDADTIGRDIAFFLIFFAVAAAAGVVELLYPLKIVLALLLVVSYALYVRRTLHSGAALEEVPDRLTLWRRRSAPPTWAVAGQATLSLALIVVGARIFVDAVEHAADFARLPAGLVALVLAPLATELPEKINSVIWVRDSKDTLALGNITGAMVFQEHRPCDVRRAVHAVGVGAAQPVLRGARPRLRSADLLRAEAQQDAPVLAAHARRTLLPRRRRHRCLLILWTPLFHHFFLL